MLHFHTMWGMYSLDFYCPVNFVYFRFFSVGWTLLQLLKEHCFLNRYCFNFHTFLLWILTWKCRCIRIRNCFSKIFSPLCTRRHKIWPSLLFFMSKQIINGSIFRPTLRKPNFAVSNQKSKKHSFKIMIVSWYFLNVASDWWYLILKY